MSTWNGNNFSIYKSEEKQVLKLIKELGDQVNYNTDNKTDKTGDHSGSWQGINKPTMSNEGLAGTVEKHELNLSDIPIENYKSLFIGNDVTLALKQAILEAPKGAMIKFNPVNTYELSDTIVIAKPVTINFNNASLGVKVGGKPLFELQFTGETDFNNRIKLINYSFKEVVGYLPTTIIYINEAINSLLQGCFNSCRASHSLIWNYKGYGNHIKGESRWADCPRIIYLSSSSDEIHSFAFNIDMDITGNTGKGIESEGANGLIRGVIESCAGGYHYNGVHNATGINVSVHFENNSLYDMKIGSEVHVDNAVTNSGIHNLIGSFYSRPVNKSIIYGSDQMITAIGCQLNGAMEPIDVNVNSTTINTLANLGAYDEVLTPELLKLNYSLNHWGEHKANKMQTKELTTNVIKQTGEDNLGLFLKNNTQIYFTDTEISVSKSGYDIGGRWGMFRDIYSNSVHLSSAGGKVFKLVVSETGVITTVEV